MQLDIITPSETVFSGEVTLVQLPGVDGLFEILRRHAALVAAMGKGRAKIVGPDEKTRYFEISGGVVEVHNDKILVLAE